MLGSRDGAASPGGRGGTKLRPRGEFGSAPLRVGVCSGEQCPRGVGLVCALCPPAPHTPRQRQQGSPGRDRRHGHEKKIII